MPRNKFLYSVCSLQNRRVAIARAPASMGVEYFVSKHKKSGELRTSPDFFPAWQVLYYWVCGARRIPQLSLLGGFSQP